MLYSTSTMRTEIRRGFPQSLQADSMIVPHIRSQPLPYTSCLIHCSPIIRTYSSRKITMKHVNQTQLSLLNGSLLVNVKYQ
jgi:hypothetical protein